MNDVDALIEQVRGSPKAMINFARTMLMPKDAERAQTLCNEALALAPGDGEIRAMHADALGAAIEDGYFKMVRDETRYQILDRALRRVLGGGGRVLDIGTGVGLLAMIAARAGADEVVTCEQNAVVAETAKAVIAANGLQRKVKVVAKKSTDLVVGLDMAGPADVLVWDNIGSNMLGAGALPTIEDALRRLVIPGAPVIPARGTIWAALAEDARAGEQHMGRTLGFDLSPFNRLARGYTIKTEAERLSLRSEPVALFEFDFACGGPYPAERVGRQAMATGGNANGVVQWLELAIDDHDIYCANPGVKTCAFALVFHPAPASFEAACGERFIIGASHDRVGLWVWLENP